MDDRIISGNAIAADVRAELKAEVEKFKADGYIAPGLVVILVGDRTDSATYVRMKEKACQEVGFNSTILRYPANVTQDEIVAKCAYHEHWLLSPSLLQPNSFIWPNSSERVE